MKRTSRFACPTWLTTLLCTSLLALPGWSSEEGPAPPVVRPGDPVVDGSFLQPYRNAWRYTRRSKDGKIEVDDLWTDDVSLVEEDGSLHLVRRQSFPSAAGPRVLVQKVRRSDLVPRSFELEDDDGRVLQRIVFEDRRIWVTLGEQEPVEVPLTEPVFDGYLYGLLLSSFPLAPGYEASFPILNASLTPAMQHLRVVTREPVPGPDGASWPCWRVETDEGLTFWIAEQPPYVLRVHKKRDDGGRDDWQLAAETGLSRFLELRAYTTVRDRRDAFLAHFETYYLASQEAVGMRIWGQFRDLNEADRFVWMRGYRSMDDRQEGLLRFYTSPLWQQTGGTVRDMLAARATHVHLLEPVSPAHGFDDRLDRSAAARGVVVAFVFLVSDDMPRRLLAERLESSLIPAMVAEGATPLGLFRSSDQPNNFPALPVIEDEPVVVWIASFASRSDFDAVLASVPLEPNPFETFVLAPGDRSRLGHRPAGK